MDPFGRISKFTNISSMPFCECEFWLVEAQIYPSRYHGMLYALKAHIVRALAISFTLVQVGNRNR
jgi:hypothetical protein